ncbi:hypothetical protein [Lichenicoccus sp.]|uniref:hypothetical protein n=1 Tax=Lichenicoccus sp. TaxID=2781899 RepID=UPI003D0BFC92
MRDPGLLRWSRRLLLGTGGWLAACSTVAGRIAARADTPAATPISTPGETPLPAALSIAPPGERRVGIGYALWHQDDQWQRGTHKSWGTPVEGYYRSDDPAVLTRHAGVLSGAGVDFIVVDWSNDLAMDVRRAGGPATQRFIEQATVRLFDTWRTLPHAPRVVLMIGNPGAPAAVHDGSLAAKADEVHALFAADPARRGLLLGYLGRPLLLVYVNTPTPWGHSLPPWQDDRFTVRFVTGFVTQQQSLIAAPDVSRYGYWSWEDRGDPTYSVYAGHPECMTVVASWRGTGSRGRDGGRTYLGQWSDARRIGPRFVLAGTFNEWWVSEQIDPLHSKDVEPSRELGAGTLNILRRQSALFKQGA